MKLSANAPCPCHSGEKYKKCCQPYHKGILPANALKLMRSRYSAYALQLSGYIIATTHPDNPEYTPNTKRWSDDILEFCRHTRFLGLQIIGFIDGEDETYVTFKAIFERGSLQEKSRFLKREGKWLYASGEFL